MGVHYSVELSGLSIHERSNLDTTLNLKLVAVLTAKNKKSKHLKFEDVWILSSITTLARDP